MIVVKLEVLDFFNQCFEELVGREEVIKSVERDGVLYTWVMCIKSDKVGNTHIA